MKHWLISYLYSATFYLHNTLNIDELKEKNCMLEPTQDLNADFIIGAVFPVQNYDSIYGKHIFNPNAIVWVESFQYALDDINQNPDLLPDIKLGYDIRNNCNNQELTIDHILELMIDQKYLENTTTLATDFQSRNDNQSKCLCRQNKKRKMAAVIGGYSSELSGVMSHLLSTDLIPQISYGAASPTLDKSIYRSFLRTLPKDSYQAAAIADLLEKYKWTYVSVLASDDDYGRLAVNELRYQMRQRQMCLATERFFDPTFPGQELNKTLNDIYSKIEMTNIVILWCDFQPALSIISEAYRQGFRNITWIGTESWGNAMQLTNVRLALSNLSVIGLTLREETVPDFEEKINLLSWTSKHQNPWLAPMWESLYYCPQAPKPWPPTGCLPFEPQGKILPKYKHYNVMAAVYAVAYGLHSYLQCEKINDLYRCPKQNASINYGKLLEHIKNSSFIVKGTEAKFHFDKDGNAGFSSYNFRALTQPTPTVKLFKEIGQWNGGKNEIKLLAYDSLWSNNASMAKGVCSAPCQPGYYILRSPVSCCWSCHSCPIDTISVNISQDHCLPCNERQVSNSNHTQCRVLDRMNLSLYNLKGKIIVTAAILGGVLVLFVMGVFIRHWDTPVVKSSSREMSLIQLSSMFLLFCMPSWYLLPISTFVCIAKMTSFGILYVHVIAFIVIKTYRLLRVFNRQRFTELSKYLKNRYQVLFSFMIVLVEVVGVVIWYSLLRNIPKPQTYRLTVRSEDGHSNALSYIDYCGVQEDYIMFGVISYIFCLSIVCGYMAFRARRLPENFNEAQFIWFAMFTTCLAWSLFFLLYMSLDRTQKPLVFLCMTIVNNYCLLVLLYGPKLIIILLRPNLNTQANFRKMAANATVTTFYKEVDPTGVKRPREQSVISFDFDNMFEEYKKRQQEPTASAGLARRITFRLQKHFSSFRTKKPGRESPMQKRIQRKQNDSQNKTKHDNNTIAHDNKLTNVFRRSISLDEFEIKRLSSSSSIEHREHHRGSTKSTSTNVNRISVDNGTELTDLKDDVISFRVPSTSFRPNSTSLTSLISKAGTPRDDTASDSSDETIRPTDNTDSILAAHGIMGQETYL